MKKILIILILLLSSATIHYTKAQTITSLLTQSTTDLLKGDVRNGFSWKNMTYSLLSTNIYAKRGDEPDETCNANNIGAIGYGSCSYCLGPEGYGDYDISYQCTPTGWHETGRQKKQTVLVGGGGSSGGNTGNGPPTGTPSNNDKPDDWYPPSVPTEPIDINGGGGAIGTPWQPNNNPNNNNHNPTKPTKPYTTLGDDSVKATITIPPLSKDTVKPKIVTYDSLSKVLDSLTTKLVDSAAKLSRWKELHDTAYHGSREIGMAGYDSSGHIKNFNFKDSAANSQQTRIPNFDSTKNIIFIAHCHYVGIDPDPDCGDQYNLMLSKILKNDSLNNSFVINGDTAIDICIRTEDKLKMRKFLSIYPKDSSIMYLDTLPNRSFANPVWNTSFTGFGPDTISLGNEFKNALKILEKKNYPEKLRWLYAEVYMMERYQMGIRLQQLCDDGKWHSLGCTYAQNANGTTNDITITIKY